MSRCAASHSNPIIVTDLVSCPPSAAALARSADPTKGFEANMQITDGRGSASTDFLGDYKGIGVSGNDVLDSASCRIGTDEAL